MMTPGLSKEDTLLSRVPEGKMVMITGLTGGEGMRRRLMDLGLKRGVTVTVLHTHRPGPCIVRCGQAKIMIGRGMTEKIQVRNCP